MDTAFCYETAFARNIGLITEPEQQRIARARVGLAGLGGVGGAHLQALARLGIGAFHLADPDRFEIVNLNRQFGAALPTVGRNKADVMGEMARAINPEANVLTFPDGITAENIGVFLDQVDVVVDGIEFFCIGVRRMLYRECRARGIPVVNAGPIGYGAAVLVFTRESMSFDKYFRIEDDMTRAEQLLAQALGLAPGLVSDVDPSRVDVEGEKGPALASACLMCAAAAATEVLKILCGRGRVTLAPRGTYYDPYRGRIVPLRPRPGLRTLRGRLLRWMSFRKFPAFQALHDRELAARAARHAAAELETAQTA